MSFEFDNFKLLIFVYNQSSWVLERGLMQEAIPASQCSDFYFCKMLKIYGGLIGEIDWLSSCPPLYLDLCFSLIDVVLSIDCTPKSFFLHMGCCPGKEPWQVSFKWSLHHPFQTFLLWALPSVTLWLQASYLAFLSPIFFIWKTGIRIVFIS